ncbi:MAG: FHA domain-containing protein [Myxococcales bacterium]|nr:FHA domain-containing protein [Myxococcales bacterium]
MDESRFVAKHGDLFLVKRPSPVDHWDEDIQYQTVFVPMPELDGDYEDGARFDASWRATPVRKRPGNPFPDRISVGRAQNCDIVLRLSYVSKLHAHFLLGPGGVMHLCDQRSANGTRVNGEPLLAGVRALVRVGDTIGFGQLEVQLVSGAQFYRLLLSQLRG